MEAAFNLEDDVFFKDLSKQISLLIMDDDDQDSLSHCPSLNFQAFSQAINPRTQASYLNYDHLQTSKRRESKGTGVFIPLSSNPRRKNHVKQPRFMASGNKFQRPAAAAAADHNPRALPHMPNYASENMINHSHDHSFNITRF